MKTTAPIQTVGIIGAGLMGRSIAALTASRGIAVRLFDVSQETLAAAVADVTKPSGGEVPLAAVCAAESIAEAAACDLVIETVIEKLEVKLEVLSSLAPHLAAETIVASNTSTIPLSRMAGRLPHPERFGGLHFCHPVSRTRLVEVIRTTTTTPAVVEKLCDHSRRLGKSPAVVGDAPGFVINRLLLPYLTEASELLIEGVPADAIETAALRFGMPMGPLTQLDEIGIDVAVHSGAVLYLAYPDRVIASPLLVSLYKQSQWGRKCGGGFFAYSADGVQQGVNPTAANLIQRLRRTSGPLSPSEITQRLFLPMLLEATRVLDDGVISSGGGLDQALIDGIGFPTTHGGLLAWADVVGADRILSQLRPWKSLGGRYQPTRMLFDATQSGKLFHQRAA